MVTPGPVWRSPKSPGFWLVDSCGGKKVAKCMWTLAHRVPPKALEFAMTL